VIAGIEDAASSLSLAIRERFLLISLHQLREPEHRLQVRPDLLRQQHDELVLLSARHRSRVLQRARPVAMLAQPATLDFAPRTHRIV
jgi:hypothetical protein